MPLSPAIVPNAPVRAEDDFYAWVNRQAALLRAGRLDELDREGVAGELDDVRNEIYERLESALTTLFAHMLKWEFQPSHRSRRWEATIREQRKRIARLLAKNPSLKARLEEAQQAGYDYARDRASGETDLSVKTFPKQSPYSWYDVTKRSYLVDAPVRDR